MGNTYHVTANLHVDWWAHLLFGVLWTSVFASLHGIGVSGSDQQPPQLSNLRHYELVNYDHLELLDRHKQVRRSTSGHVTVDFRFEAFGRLFSVHLKRDVSTLHPQLVVETSHVSLPYDVRVTYTGFLEGTPYLNVQEATNEPSRVHGVITRQGQFEGKIYTNNETFFIERSDPSFKENNGAHSLIYKLSDVISDDNVTTCAHEQLLKRQREIHESGAFVRNARVDGYSDDVRNHGPVASLYVNSGNHEYQQERRRSRRSTGQKTICELYLQADHLFYQRYGDVEVVIEKLTQHVQAVNNIYPAIDFDGSGSTDSIGLIIKKIKVWDDVNAVGYKYPGAYAVDYLLDLFSHDNFDDFCLSYLFTYRDFLDGVLGLAWVGHTEMSGGQVNGVGMSLNTGLVTIMNYGKEVTSAVSHVTFAHELGHNFGSNHDPEDSTVCAPGGVDGNYIMYARATSGNLPNNAKISPCSVQSMNAVLAQKATGATGCFVEFTGEICGNRVVEGTEECDCGWEEECTESCCNPQISGSPVPADPPCSRKSSAVCSPSEGPCCRSTCQYSANDVRCRNETDCRHEAFCEYPSNGITIVASSICPESGSKNNATECGGSDDSLVCYNGECSGSVCLAYGRVSCQCEAEVAGNWRDERLCQICCEDNGACVSSYSLPDVPDGKVLPGTPCNAFQGYCDVLWVCRSVDPSGPLSNLKDLLLSDESWENLGDFLRERWYIPLASGIGLVLGMLLIVKFCSKSHVPKHKAYTKSSTAFPGLRKPNQIYPEGHM